MTKTGTQNRPYTDESLMVRALFSDPSPDYADTVYDFDWNDRAAVRKFAAMSDLHIRNGGSTTLTPIG